MATLGKARETLFLAMALLVGELLGYSLELHRRHDFLVLRRRNLESRAHAKQLELLREQLFAERRDLQARVGPAPPRPQPPARRRARSPARSSSLVNEACMAYPSSESSVGE